MCLQHFRGNLDNSALVDRLAIDWEVILLDNRGVGGSTGVVPVAAALTPPTSAPPQRRAPSS